MFPHTIQSSAAGLIAAACALALLAAPASAAPVAGGFELQVAPASGEVFLVGNAGDDTLLLNYEIFSDAGGLVPGGFVSLEARGLGGFELFGAPAADAVAEIGDPGLDLDGPLTLGLLYDPAADPRDLQFGYETGDGTIVPFGQGTVTYLPVPEPTAAALLLAAGGLGLRRRRR